MYLDRTLAQRIGTAKVKSKSEVTRYTDVISLGPMLRGSDRRP